MAIPKPLLAAALAALTPVLAMTCPCGEAYGGSEKVFDLLEAGAGQEATSAKRQVNETSRITGGLCVQLGSADLGFAAKAARTGRFLVHVLDADASAVAQARQQLRAQSLYGLVSVDRAPSRTTLPYADNLVNVLVIEPDANLKITAAEMARVLSPNGVVLVAASLSSEDKLKASGLEDVRPVNASGAWLMARKPWPKGMDCWTHARHAAGGNAVSGDTLVALPRCVQWVAGPPQEINYMVCSAGRNFYAGVLARNAFNGLRLWQKSLNNSKATHGAQLHPARDKARPVAASELLFAVHGSKLVAIDGATGKTVREYAEAGTPADVLYAGGILLAVDRQSVRALKPDTGRVTWNHKVTEPRCVVAGDNAVYFIQNRPRRGETVELVSLDLVTGKVRWRHTHYEWAAGVRRLVYHKGLLACEISTFKDAEEGNAIHVLSAGDGTPLWNRTFIPGMNHAKQARAMFVGNLLWVHEKGRICVGLDARTGQARKQHQAGLCHCFPPVATSRYMISGEMEVTDLETGAYSANRLTKQACGGDAGLVPANGLVNVFPKHCVCWPMLRGYAALAPAEPGASLEDKKAEHLDFPLERGVRPARRAQEPADDEWPCYRHDAWRSGSTAGVVPGRLRTLWTASLGGLPEGPIADDWRQSPFVKGPVTSPVIADGRVYVARPDAHEIVALDARSGTVQWRYTANGRVDTPPTIHRGLCLFGVKSGWVCCLRADTGDLVWRLRAAPLEKRIVAYGQLESPWPVPGSVLVVDDVAYFAAGRQPLADGGILVFAVVPSTGRILWVKRLNTLATKNFYASSAAGIDNFDLLHREGDCVAMSHWRFDRKTGQMRPVEKMHAFALLRTGGFGVAIPRGFWSYAPRQQARRRSNFRHERPYVRPLVVFGGNTLVGCTEDKRSLFRRDFDFAGGEQFNTQWRTGWAICEAAGKEGKGEAWRSQRLSAGATWMAGVMPEARPGRGIAAMVMAADTVFTVGIDGGLVALSEKDGKVLAKHDVPAPVWDGMAAAYGCLFVSTTSGDVICLAAAAGERAALTSGGDDPPRETPAPRPEHGQPSG